jgi:hypothetical protein
VKVYLENVDLNSSSGPNGFASKLNDEFYNFGVEVVKGVDESDVRLCFIKSIFEKDIPIVQRLDGISFNSSFDFEKANRATKKTYEKAEAVIIQSEFDKKIINNFFGTRESQFVINNGTSFSKIAEINPTDNYKKFDNVWSSSSCWKGRPHKRLSENVRYFKENRGPNDCLVIMGENGKAEDFGDEVFILGHVTWEKMISVMKVSKYFVHLALVDHCPNVVVDAKSCGCRIVCSSMSGTEEISGTDAIVVEEGFLWDFSTPFDYTKHELIDFSFQRSGRFDRNLDISYITNLYVNVLKRVCYV